MGHTINQNIVIWASGRVGQQVGKGECWDLADQALRKAGAKSSAELGPMDEDADYVWGDPIQLKDAQPGDILQFRDFDVTTVIEIEVDFTDGSGGMTETKEIVQSRGHHTAIVEAVKGVGLLQVLEQHVKPLGKKVQRHVIPTQNSRGAPVTSYKSVKDERGRLKPAKVVETKNVTVTGRIWAYRPKAKGG
jgi:hypothetical protein